MVMIYNAPNTSPSSVGTQLRTDYYYKKALVEVAKETFFGQLADVRSMPKNMGKTIKQYHYLPILDDRNINDQGLDANGAATSYESTIEVAGPDATGTAGAGASKYFVGNHASVDATAILAAKAAVIQWVKTYFPAVYAAMAHSSTAADYALQIAASTVVEVQSITEATIAENDVYVLTYTLDNGNVVTLTSTAMDASPTTAELVAALTGGDNATAYATLPFTITAGTNAITLTWAAAGVVNTQAAMVKSVGTGTPVTSVTTTGAWTIYDLGYRCTINDSVSGSGNLYGSSKDIGYITGKIPALSETGGRVNRVGMKRISIEGSIEKFGFFDEYTQESLDFDTDEELEMHITSESVKAANEINEDQIQIDLLNAAGVIRYTGNATSAATLSGETGTADPVVYDDFVKLGIELDNNRCPKNTTVITGSRMVDTKVVNAARYMYIGSELLPSIMKMTDYHSNQAFIPVAQYGAAGTIARGEVGAVADFRIIVVPEMMKWAGVGAVETTLNAGYYATGGQYDVFPMLVVGEGSFTTIGFQTDGKTVKFKIKHVKPDSNHSSDDPYGETGFYSIKWYYGFMALRPERIAVIKTVAEI